MAVIPEQERHAVFVYVVLMEDSYILFNMP